MRCRGKTKAGGQCKKDAIRGGLVCNTHGGSAPQVKAKAAVRAEVTAWGLTDEKVDPGETLLRLLAQSARRAQVYAAELQAKVDEFGLEKATVGVAFGEGGLMGEYIRALAQLEADERDRCANFSRLALAAGLEERRVKLAEQQGSLITDFLRAVMGDPELGLTAEQRSAMPAVIRRHLHSA